MDKIQERYDSLQADAVAAIETDYGEVPNGRYLLVIPTGGGKTFTAVKAINRLFETGILDSKKDCVLWVAHRDLLLEQAERTFERFEQQYPASPSFKRRVRYVMRNSAAKEFQADRSIRLVVIDEAHHAAAASYLPLFDRADVGVLGLTATPGRHDGASLDFERETFSIGFPDLIDSAVILRPEILEVDGGRYDFDELSDECLELLNNDSRNRKIIDALLSGKERFRKVIVYVGTQSHVHSLYRCILDSPLTDIFGSVSYITGEGNSRGCSREQFLEAERKLERSIVINVEVLTEGYDDPAVDTVVMARPTKSKLVYMQCMGRAIRRNPDDPDKSAYLVEVVDDLPNVRYRIDNRWLYADISDALEPEVIDRWYDSSESFLDGLASVCEQFGIQEGDLEGVEWDERGRYGLFLFKSYVGEGRYRHFPILLTKYNRVNVLGFFNYLSERAVKLHKDGWRLAAVKALLSRFTLREFEDTRNQDRILESMLNAAAAVSGNQNALMNEARPWITYVSFRYRHDAIPDGLEDFLDGVLNRDEIVAQVRKRAYSSGSYVVRLPQPLSGYRGHILAANEGSMLEDYIAGLQALREDAEPENQAQRVKEYIEGADFPLEDEDRRACLFIVRESSDYLYQLP